MLTQSVKFIGNICARHDPHRATIRASLPMNVPQALSNLSVLCGGLNCYDIGVFFDGISDASITMKYNQMNAGLMRNKKMSDKITNLKR